MVRVRQLVLDAATAVAVAVACGFAAQWQPWMASVAMAVPVFVRRRVPTIGAVTAISAAGVLLVGGAVPTYASAVLCIPVAVNLYTVAAAARPARSVPVLILGLGAAALLAFRWPAAPLVAGTTVAAPWLVSWTVRHRRRAAQRIADERTAHAVAEERLRIARDIHDTVSHSLSMITMKASVALHVAAVRPDESAAALAVIETTSRDALVEMRRALGLLRADDDPAAVRGDDDDLRTLADHARQAGLRVRLDLTGGATAPPEIRIAVYRIVQQALTNVIQHARATSCVVTVGTGAEAVTLEVLDDGMAEPGTIGHGLRGMRERSFAYGGSFRAGPHSEGGFIVAARIPYGISDRNLPR